MVDMTEIAKAQKKQTHDRIRYVIIRDINNKERWQSMNIMSL